MRSRKLLVSLAIFVSLVAVYNLPLAFAGGPIEDGGTNGDATRKVKGVEDGEERGVVIDGLSVKGGSADAATPIPEWMLSCYHAEATEGSLVESGWELASRATGDSAQEWLILYCPVERVPLEQQGRLNFITELADPVYAAWPRSEDPPASLSRYLVEGGLALVRPPVSLGYSSPVGDESMPMITQLETWLWLPEGQQQPISETSSVFGYAVTVTIVPYKAEFTAANENGHSESVTCSMEQMVPWDRKHTGPIEQTTDCQVFFRHSIGESTLTTVVYYDTTVSCNYACAVGDLLDVVAVRTRQVEVDEWLVRND